MLRERFGLVFNGRSRETHYSHHICEQLRKRIQEELAKKGVAHKHAKRKIVQNNTVAASVTGLIEKENAAIDKKNEAIANANGRLLRLHEQHTIPLLQMQQRWREAAPRILGRGSVSFAQWFKTKHGSRKAKIFGRTTATVS